MNLVPLLALAAVLATSSVFGAEKAATRDIVYRGGALTLQIPKDWTDEYEPDGSGVFYEDVPGSGTLRLHVATAESPPDAAGNAATLALTAIPGVDARAIERLPTGSALAKVTRRTTSKQPMTLFWWYVASPAASRPLRVATFSYTVLTANEGDARTQRDLDYVEQAVRAARFGVEPAR